MTTEVILPSTKPLSNVKVGDILHTAAGCKLKVESVFELPATGGGGPYRWYNGAIQYARMFGPHAAWHSDAREIGANVLAVEKPSGVIFLYDPDGVDNEVVPPDPVSSNVEIGDILRTSWVMYTETKPKGTRRSTMLKVEAKTEVGTGPRAFRWYEGQFWTDAMEPTAAVPGYEIGAKIEQVEKPDGAIVPYVPTIEAPER